MTASQLREIIKGVVESHATHNTFYSIWSDVKDRETELNYPCAIWDQWRSRLEDDEFGHLRRAVLVRLLIITAVATDRTPADRDAAVEAADNAASDYVLKLRKEYPDLLVGNVGCTTQFDEYTQLETGVLLTFTVTGEGMCLDEDTFNPPADCPTLCELLASAEWATVKACLTPEALEDAETDLGGECPDATARMVDSEDTELDSQTVAPGDTVTLVAPDVLILQSNSEPGIPVGTTPAGSVYPLPMSVIQYYEDDGGLTYTEDYDTLFIGPQITPSQTIPARDLLNAADEVVGDRKITLADLINNTVPQCPVPDPCDPLDYEIYNTEATLLIDGSQVDPCGALVQLAVQDGAAVLKDTGGTTLSTTAIPATSTKNITAPNGTVTRDGSPYGTVLSGGILDVPSALFDIQVQLDGVDYTLIEDVDPSVANTININIS